MKRARSGLLAAWTLCACATDFLVNDDGPTPTGTGSSGGAESGVATTQPGTSSSAEGGSSATGSTTSSTESGRVDTGSSAEAGSTSGVEGSTSTAATSGLEATAEATAGSTTGELPCGELGMEQCAATDGCAWQVEPAMCVDDPCFDPTDGGSECFDMVFLDCVELVGCAWMGTGDMGACAPNGCWECGSMQNQSDCIETDMCMWIDLESTCAPV